MDASGAASSSATLQSTPDIAQHAASSSATLQSTRDGDSEHGKTRRNLQYLLEPVPVILDVETARKLKTSRIRLLDEFHDEARRALQTVIKMGPANGNVCHIARAAATEHSIDPPWTTWKEYIANLPTAEEIIGPGIVSITAEFIEGTKDANRHGQPRCDFVAYRADGSYWRIHPGASRKNDAKPRLFQAPVAASAATEHTPSASAATEHTPSASEAWLWRCIKIPFDATTAAKIPQGDRLSKKRVWEWVEKQQWETNDGMIDVTDGSHHFQWWLWASQLEQTHGSVVDPGITHVLVDSDGCYRATFCFCRVDGSMCKVELYVDSRGGLQTKVSEEDAVKQLAGVD